MAQLDLSDIMHFVNIQHIDLLMLISVALFSITLTKIKSSKWPFVYLFASYYNTITTTALPYNNWTLHATPTSPRRIDGSAVGHDPSNHIIWFVGGWQHVHGLMAFDYINNIFTNYDYPLSMDVAGDSQNYAQVGTSLYILDLDNPQINLFNTQTSTFSGIYATPSSFDGVNSCFVNIRDEYLAVLADDKKVLILNISSQDWLSGVPSLQITRYAASCIYLNDKMFIMGGYNVLSFHQSIQYLNVSSASMMNKASMSWKYNTNSLPQSVAYSRCIAVNDDILVIGGVNDGIRLNTVYVINSISGSVSLGGNLVEAIDLPAVVVVNNILYSFGGVPILDEWQSTPLFSFSPTTEPSKSPINTVTKDPSYAPSQYIMTSSSIFNHTPTVETTPELVTSSEASIGSSISPSISKGRIINISNETVIVILTVVVVCSCCCIGVLLYFLVKYKKRATIVVESRLSKDIVMDKRCKDDELKGHRDRGTHEKDIDNKAMETVQGDENAMSVPQYAIATENRKREGSGLDSNDGDGRTQEVLVELRTKGNDNIADDEFIVKGDDETKGNDDDGK